MLGLNLDLLFPVELDDTERTAQRILECGVQYQESVIVRGKNPVDVIGRLLGSLDIFRAARYELDHLGRAEEDAHERRHDAVDRVSDIRRHNLRAALFLVAKRLTAIVFNRSSAVRREVVIDERYRIDQLGLHYGLQLAFVHRLRAKA